MRCFFLMHRVLVAGFIPIRSKFPMKKPLSKLERVPLREAWKHEANDFTPWLADVLGFADLELVATEHWVGRV